MVDKLKAIAVVGAAGIVGKSVVQVLIEDDEVDRIVAIDSQQMDFSSVKVEDIKLDIFDDFFSEALLGCDSVVYLLEDSHKRSDLSIALKLLKRVMQVAEDANCGHLVLLSSAMVYGARQTNPVPLTEASSAEPISGLAHANVKLGMEKAAIQNSSENDLSLAILRPTVTVSKNRMSLISNEIMSARSVKTDELEAPTQYLHLDDLASAIVIASKRELLGVYNVSPNSWIGQAELKELSPEPDQKIEGRLRSLYVYFLKSTGLANMPTGLEPYINFPWVVSNDKLKSEGWEPRYTNSEAYVSYVRTPYWQILLMRYRQEVSLIGASAGVFVLSLVAFKFLKRVFRRLTR